MQIKKKHNFLIILLALAFLPFVSSLQIDSGTVINNSVLNLTINFTDTAFADSFETSPAGFIYFNDLRSTETNQNTFTFNITTEVNNSITGTPLFFVTSSNTKKTFDSILSVSQPTIISFSVESCETGTITYTPTTGSPQTFSSSDYTCSNNQVILPSVNIPPSSSGNQIDITYGCGRFRNLGFNLIMIGASLMVLSIVTFLFYRSYQEGTLSVGKFISISIILLVALAMWYATSQVGVGNCAI